MTHRPATTCMHELRPGTTVCLHCRAEARTAQRARQQSVALKALAAGGAVLALGILAFAGMSMRGTSVDTGSSASLAPATGGADRSGAATPAGPVAPAASTPSPGGMPIVPPGRTDLGNGVFAERQGSLVVVNFDTQGARTRRSDKFEAVVRRTLPAVLGDVGRAALDRVRPGTLVPGGQLLAAAERGALRLPVGDGRVIQLTPLTRMGEDGPLVVTYRVLVDSAAPAPAS